ncbi:amino acid ABC transporter substrate-binding protein [soil metagenome]
MARGSRAAAVLAVGLCLLASGCNRQRGDVAPSGPMIAAPGGQAAAGSTLKAVRLRGRVNCGVHQGAGFAEADPKGGWRGFDVDLCRAVAAAVLGDARAVNIVPQTNKGFSALQTGQVDLLAHGAAWTLTRDAGLHLTFARIVYFDGQGFLTPKKLNIKKATELSRARICVVAATTAESNLVEYFRTQNLNIKRVVLETEDLARQTYEAGGCEAMSDDVSVLASSRAAMAAPENQVIMAETISKEPLGPATREGDEQWDDIVRWTMNSLILAEELGLKSETVDQARRHPPSEEAGRLLDGDLGRLLGLKGDWAYQVVRQVGGYGEVFERNLGPATPLKLERGQNALWNASPPGLLYSPPIR